MKYCRFILKTSCLIYFVAGENMSELRMLSFCLAVHVDSAMVAVLSELGITFLLKKSIEWH